MFVSLVRKDDKKVIRIFQNGTLALFCLLFILWACKRDAQQITMNNNVEASFDTGYWPKKTTINAMAMEILNEWPEYLALENSFERIYRIENTEELELLVEDLIEAQKALAESDYPKAFNKPHIKSRQAALRTYILKTKGSLEYRLDLQEPITEMIVSFNALRNQFNVIVNNTIDASLILDELSESN